MKENVYRLLRIANDKSIKELSEEMGVAASYISEVENGKRRPSDSMRQKYSRALGVRPSTIMYFEEQNDETTISFQDLLLSILKVICKDSNM